MSWALAVAMAGHALASAWAEPTVGRVELHAHLMMRDGMGWSFTGPLGRAHATIDPTRRLTQQVDAEGLARSGLAVVVVTLYAHPWLSWAPALDGPSPRAGVRGSLERQWQSLLRFLTEHPEWVLVRGPAQAREALARGKRAMVLALEGAWGAVDTDAGFELWVKKRGLSILTLTHLTGDELGGAALLPGLMQISHPWAAWNRVETFDGATNPEGLTEAGLQLAKKALTEGVWLDFAHLPDSGWTQILNVLDLSDPPPLLVTHTVSRTRLGAERAISEDQLRWVRASHGVVGLLPSEEFLKGPDEPVPARCGEALDRLAHEWGLLARWVGPENTHFGSDFNGGVPHLRADCQGRHGLAGIGDVSGVWEGLAARGLKIPTPESHLEAFLAAWTRAQDYPRRQPLKGRPSSGRKRRSRARAR